MFKRYLKDTSGQFAIMFAGAATALLLSAASAIDIIGMQKQRSQLQSMTDAAAIAAAAAKTDNLAEIKKLAEAAADANNLIGQDYKLQIKVVGEVISVSASTNYDTQLMGMLGFKNLPVSALTEAPIPEETPVNIALVLDSTGSMAGDNMIALKSASKTLLTVFDDSTPGTIQAGVVPYNRWVNVGMSNRNRSWMDVPDDNSTTSPETCRMTKPLVDSSLCTTTTIASTCTNDSGTYDCDRTSTSCPAEAYGPEEEYCYTPTSSETWYGCVTSREDPFQFEPAYQGKKIQGVMNRSCGTEILDLTTNLNDVEAHIDSLTASGNTYIPAGLIWGWRLLDASEPFGGLTNAEIKRKRALILMTDGNNTVYNNSSNYHATTYDADNVKKANDDTAKLCALIKEDGIDIYSVAYKLGSGDPAMTKLINDCASSPEKAFIAENQQDLEKAFKQIARSLFVVRISR